MIYDDKDIVTYYFIIVIDDKGNSMVQGWTDNKALAKFYMEFHKCKRFTLKSLTKAHGEIIKILEENNNDEIKIVNIPIRNKPNHKKGHEVKYISVPMTETEFTIVNEEVKNLLSSYINYGYLDSVIPYLKKKYRDALNDILLLDCIRKTVHNQDVRIVQEITIDQLSTLYMIYRDNFGE